MKLISTTTLDELLANQKFCEDLPPVTTHACFQLDELENLIKNIHESNQYKESIKKKNETRYHIAVLLVRQEVTKGLSELVLNVNPFTKKIISEYIQTKADKKFTQLVPVLAGCVSVLNEERIVESFELISNEKDLVEVLTPGGEGTGLIPPPKTIK